MKKILFIIVTLLMVTPAFSQTFTHIQTIDVSSATAGPTGIAFYNDDIYLAAFSERTIVKVEDPTDAGYIVSTFADLSGIATWDSGRGVNGIDINQSTGEIYASGDHGTGSAIARVDQTGTITASYNDETYRCGGCALWGSDPDLLITNILTGLGELDAGLVGYETFAASATIYPRDVTMFGDDIFAAYTNGGTNDGILRFTGGTAGDLAGYTASNWVALASGTWNTGCGVFYWDYNGGTPMDYVLFSNLVDYTLEFYDAADASLDITLGLSESINSPRDACVGTIDGNEYLFVSDGSMGQVEVFGIDGATNVDHWNMF
jgi:hypothetical protein